MVIYPAVEMNAPWMVKIRSKNITIIKTPIKNKLICHKITYSVGNKYNVSNK